MIVRKSNVAFSRWKDFRTAVSEMISAGTYAKLAEIHAAREREPDGLVRSRHRMHGTMFGPVGYRRFLPWHRAYLIAFERELRQIDDTLSIPYWDWDNDQGRLEGFRNFLALADSRDVGLRPGEQSSDLNRRRWFSSEELTVFFETFEGDYYFFTRTLESGTRTAAGMIVGQHNAGHSWMGGDMAIVRNSPNDVAFWLHHAAVDRVWAKWQEGNPGERAFLSGQEAKLDPWDSEFNVENIDDIGALGEDSYAYEDPVRPAPSVEPPVTSTTPLFT